MVRCSQLVDRIFFLGCLFLQKPLGFCCLCLDIVSYALFLPGGSVLRHGLVPESCSARAASTKRCVTEGIIVYSIGFATAGTKSSTDSPCGTFGPETWHTDILLKSALQDHLCSFSFKWLDTSWKNLQPRVLEQVIGNGPNSVFRSGGLMLCTEITQSGHQRRPPLAPRSAQPRFIFLR